MKIVAWLAAGILVAGMSAAHGQQVLAGSSTAPPPSSGLPPPGINDPGVQPQSVPLPKPGLRPSVAPAARAQGSATQQPDVAVSTDSSGDTIREYSRNGIPYEVQITPKHGVTQTYHYDSPNGSLMHDPRLGPVSPVYYTIYQWGARKPAPGASAGGPASAGTQ